MRKLAGLSILLCLTILGMAGCAQAPANTAQAAQPEVKELPIPLEFKDSTEKEFSLGGVLKTYDDIAWLATDAVLAAGYKPQAAVNPAYIVEPTGDDLNGVFQFAFIEESNGKLSVAAIADVDHTIGDMGKVTGVRIMNPAPEPSFNDAQMYRALQAAEKAPGLAFCQAIYNHVVIPYRENGKTEYRVYFLMSTTTKGAVPVGGHILVRVAEDAKTVLEVKPLAKSCGMYPGADDPRAVALEFTNLALDSPSAAQVFLMLRYKKPVYVATKNGYLWGIDSRGIRLLATDLGQKKTGGN